MSTKYLFSETDFGDFADNIRRNISSKIEKMVERSFQDNTIEELAADFFKEYSLKAPVLHMEQAFQRRPVTVKISIDSEYQGKVTQKVDGTRFEVILPYTGKAELLDVRPTNYSYDPPYGEVSYDGIHFIYEVQIFHDHSIVRTSFDQNYLNISYWLDNLKKDIIRFNSNLHNEIIAALKNRYGMVTQYGAIDTLLGFPIK